MIMDSAKTCIVMITVPDMKTGENIARVMLEEKLAACVNIIGGVRSMFWWDGQIDKSDECMLMLKTVEEKAEQIGRRVKKLHPYKLPETISVQIASGTNEYLDWIRSSVS